MHYDYFDFQHQMNDDDRVKFIQKIYEELLTTVAEGSGRKVNKLLRFLRESDFYRIPCRHHAFVGGNAWHQIETLIYAYSQPEKGAAQNYSHWDSYHEWQPQWLAGDPMGIVIVSLMHDICNVQEIKYPDRIMRRHGRKSTYVIKDFLKFDLMFDENMAIIHHLHKDPQILRENVFTEEDCNNILSMPLYQMIRHCDTLSCIARMTEAELTQRLPSLRAAIAQHHTDYLQASLQYIQPIG